MCRLKFCEIYNKVGMVLRFFFQVQILLVAVRRSEKRMDEKYLNVVLIFLL